MAKRAVMTARCKGSGQREALADGGVHRVADEPVLAPLDLLPSARRVEAGAHGGEGQLQPLTQAEAGVHGMDAFDADALRHLVEEHQDSRSAAVMLTRPCPPRFQQ